MAPLPTSPVSTSLLLLPVPTLHQLLTPQQFYPSIRQASLLTSSHLTIYLLSSLFQPPPLGLPPSAHWETIQTFLGKVYGEAVRVAQKEGRVLFEVDVVMQGLGGEQGDERRWEGRNEAEEGKGWEVIWRLEGDDSELPSSLPTLPSSSFVLPYSPSPLSSSSFPTDFYKNSPKSPLPATYPVVALGGSFDHIHAGHKILLTMAILVASRKLIVGVSDDALLVHKAHSEYLQPLSLRKQLLSSFVNLINPSLEYEIVAIKDVYGPTATDPDIQALVLSQETVAGGEAIAKHRKEHALSSLHTFIISVISHMTDEELGDDGKKMKEVKMSSTFIREWIASKKAASKQD